MTCPSCGSHLDEADAAFCGICGAPTRARRPTLVGSILDERYRVDAKLAEGGFGSIYRATHVASGLDVALKVLHADLASDSSLATRFRREAACLERLHDPHTVACYEVGEAPDGTLYIAMELLVGQSLHDRMLARGRLGWRTALSIVREACSSLAEAHELGIVHRDLKPANVHLGANDYVKVLDFGIARIANSEVDDGNELTRMGQMIGTLEYMAPEQVLGGACDPRSDIYQLGILMYEMITGRRPFAGSANPTSLITALLTQTPPAPSTMMCGNCLPQEVDRLILRCLEREPQHRYASVHRLVDAIDAALLLSDAPTARHLDADDEAPTWIASSHSKASTMAPARTTIGPRADVVTPEYLRHIPTIPSTEMRTLTSEVHTGEATEVQPATRKFPSGERRLATGTPSPTHEVIVRGSSPEIASARQRASSPSLPGVTPIAQLPPVEKRASSPALPGLPPVRESSGNLALAELASAMAEQQRVAEGSSNHIDIAAGTDTARKALARTNTSKGPNSDLVVAQLVYPLASERPRRDTPPSDTPIARPGMSFGARVAMWTAALAAGGATVGALIASLLS